MTFTDDDLKRLKEDLEIPRSHGLFLTTQRLVLIDALLARLEAAEKVCNLMAMEHLTNNYRCEEVRFPLEAWRKSKGEGK